MSSRRQGRVVLGTMMLSFASAAKLALQFLLVPVLARFLGPKVFGLMGVATSFAFLAMMLSDGGMGAALVSADDPDEDTKSTVFWISVLIGLGLALLLCAAAWPIAMAFAEPQLALVICTLSPVLVLCSSLCVSNSVIVRMQRFELFAIGELVCTVLSAAAGVALAVAGYGVWSLVSQQLVLWVTKAGWVLAVAPFRPRFVLRTKLARPLFRFSANNLAANVTDFIGRSAPVLIVTSMLGVSAAGQYSMGSQLTRVADLLVSKPINVVTFSAVAGAPNRYAAATFATTALRLLLTLLLPFAVGILFTAEIAAPLLLGSKWMDTGPVLAGLAPGGLVLCLYAFANSVFLGRSHSGRVFKLTLLTTISIAAGTYVGAHWGTAAAVIGFSAGAILMLPLYVHFLAQSLQVPISDIVSTGKISLVAVTVMTVSMFLVRAQIGHFSESARLTIEILTGVVTYSGAAMWIGGRQILDDIARLQRRNTDSRAERVEIVPRVSTSKVRT